MPNANAPEANTNTPPLTSTQAPSQYSVNWNNVALQAITAGLDEIPVVGGILSHLLDAFWPESGEDVWAEIKQNVEQLIDQSISKDVYGRVQTALGSPSANSGLAGVMNNYLNSLTPDPSVPNPVPPQTYWADAEDTFTNALAAFQQDGYQLLLLPLFAQFANMHLSLLRDGVKEGWYDADSLQKRIGQYTGYAEEWYEKGYTDRTAPNQGFNYLNQYVQGMQISVLYYKETWPYFNPAQYPPPVKVTFTEQTYFTITGSLGRACGDYTLPATPDGEITNIEVYWLNDLYDNYNLVLGTQVNYNDAQQPYSGVLIGGAVPPVGKPCDPNNDYFCYFKQGAAVSAGNPVVAVSGTYESAGGAYCIDLVYQDGTSTGVIPQQTGQDYPLQFNIAPPQGYYLRSIWVPASSFWYNAAVDVVFGFGFTPPELDLATARALYVSSLQPAPADSPRYAPFAEVAASEDWEGQRQAFLSRLHKAAKP
jgi:hypothetical protein